MASANNYAALSGTKPLEFLDFVELHQVDQAFPPRQSIGLL